ncbi:MAG: RNA polymerase sigma factor [Terrisporobacter sp.]|uniref:RNA polymerase sigma factor n=1 Tax=Terrisporobacter sp. TaxID=1965305 RepID=UPI002FC5A7DF
MELEDIENIISEYGNVIYKFCIKLTGNKDDGEDLYQQTFLKAVEIKHKIDKNNNPKSFLVSMSVKIWKNSVRKNGRRKSIAPSVNIDEYEFMDVKDTKANLESNIIKKETEKEVNLVVKNLEDKFKLPVIMHYTAELSLEEIAKALKIPKGTVKSRLHKARQIIKKEMEDMGYEGL